MGDSEVQVMAVTKAIGMGKNNENVRHVIRNSVPPNINTWVQELGRAGRSGQAATATIFIVKPILRMCLAGFVTIFGIE